MEIVRQDWPNVEALDSILGLFEHILGSQMYHHTWLLFTWTLYLDWLQWSLTVFPLTQAVEMYWRSSYQPCLWAATTLALVAFFVNNCQSHEPEMLCRIQFHDQHFVRRRVPPESWLLPHSVWNGCSQQPVWMLLGCFWPSGSAEPFSSRNLGAYHVFLFFISSPASVDLNLLKQKEPLERGKVIVFKFLLVILI